MRLFLISLILILNIGCKKDDAPIFYGYHIYPNNQGNFAIYEVIDIFHDIALSPAHDTNRYQIKEKIGETELNDQGNPYQKLYRYYRLNDTMNWVLQDVWTIEKSNQRLLTNEENKKRISLAFSVSYDRYWDYNAYNEDESLTARYDNIYEPVSINNLNFDSTVTVEIENFTSFIDYKRQYDIYATNVGRIKRVKKDLEINNSDTTDIKKGTELFYTIVSYGIE